MPEQFSFPGFDNAPPPSPPAASVHKAGGDKGPHQYSLFFSLFPATADATGIASIAGRLLREQGITSKPLLPHRLHVTLHDLGNYDEVPQELIDAAIRAGNALACAGFEVAFDRALSYPSSKTYVLSGREGCRELTAFRGELGEALQSEGLKVKRSFTPHMTLTYDRKVVAEHAIEPVRWTAREFVLIRSHVGKGIYDLLGRWPLHRLVA